jgi:acyl carrier protein
MLDVLREVVAEILAVEPDSITEDSKIREELGADSIDLVEIVYALEDRFDVTLSEDGLRGVRTVGEALDLFGEKQ